ncbi:MAG: ankyrin repeat domain-containing protein, partial [bacterium]
TALHMASANGFLDIVKLLLQQQGQNGAAVINVNVQNESGNTALHYASLNGKKDVVQGLLLFIPKNINSNSQQINSSNEIFKKIDANIKNNMGRIAFEEGLQAGHGDIAEMLAPLS